jgi:dCMP deaminase
VNAARANEKALAFMDVAMTISDLGTCDRKRVGCLIVRDGRCVSWGYNGAPPGLPHCADNNHGWRSEKLEGYDALQEVRMHNGLASEGCRNATHAEANALAAAAKQGISTDGGTLFTTCSPCDICSRLIIAAGITRVYYREEYRDDSGLRLLAAAGIVPNQL